jgi:hypothetical protein
MKKRLNDRAFATVKAMRKLVDEINPKNQFSMRSILDLKF